jgi:phosphonate transport system substrate-binding protein
MIDLKKIFLIVLIFLAIAQMAVAEQDIVFAISPMASPASTLSNYADFIAYLSKKTDNKIILKQRKKYAEINALLKTGEAHFALTCTGAYLSGRSEFGLEILVVPVINGKTTYNSYIIVNKDSSIESFHQLQGKVFAFTDPLSLSGRLYPVYLLYTMEMKQEEFFKKTFYTSSHEKSIESVAYGFADSASVDSLIFEDMKRMKHPAIDETKIINISPSYGIPPIVISPVTQTTTRQLMLKALLKMKDDREGIEILKKLQIENFILPNPAIYHNAVILKNKTMQTGFFP